jgi:hypothetical protein
LDVADLRARVSALGASPFDVVLPGDTDVAPLEGALTIEPHGDGWALVTVDYGVHWLLEPAQDRASAEAALLAYLDRQLPSVRPAPPSELDDLAGAIAVHYFDLRDRAAAAGIDGVVIDIPPGVLLDRIGALDGIHLYPIDTPLELRSLPPTALRVENDVHQFLTRGTVRVRAVITPPWFGRPGGGLRFTLQEPRVGIRDLVATGVLERIVRSA